MPKVGFSQYTRWVARWWLCLFIGAGLLVGVVAWLLIRHRGGPPAPQTVSPARGIAAEAKSETEAEAQAEEQSLRREQIAAAMQLAESYPQSDDALHLLGLVYREQGNFVEAVKCWRKALELDPTRADSCVMLAAEALLREEYAEAESLCRKALATDPRTPGAVECLAKAVLNQGRAEDAAALLSKLPFLNADGLILLGEAYRALGDFEKARKLFERALQVRPKDPDALYGLAMSLGRLGETEKAREVMEAFRKVREERREIAVVWRESFDPRAITAESVAHTHTDVGRVYRALGDDRKSEEMWLRAAALDPKNVVARMELSALYLQKGRPAEAAKLLEELMRLRPSDAEILFRLGSVYARLGRHADASRVLERAKELAPGDARIRRAYEELEERR